MRRPSLCRLAHRRSYRAAIVLLGGLYGLIAGFPVLVVAQESNSTLRCEETGALEARLASCTKLLEADQRRSNDRRAALLVDRARIHAEAGDLQAAASDLTEAIERSGNYAPAFAARADLLRANEQCEVALADYVQAIRLLPNDLNLYMNRARCLVDLGEVDGALSDIDQVITAGRDREQDLVLFALRAKARLLVEKSDFDAALQGVDKAIAIAAGDAELYVERGDIHLKKKQFDKAAADFDTAIEKAKAGPVEGQVVAALARASGLSEMGRPADAEAQLNEAVALDTKDVAALKARAEFFQKAGRLKEAIADLGVVIERQPGDAGGRAARGAAQFIAGDWGASSADLKALNQDCPTLDSVLLSYIAQTRATGKDASAELTAGLAKLPKSEAVPAFVEAMLGKKPPQAAEAAATTPEQRCETNFYLGEWYLLKSNKPLAAKALKVAVNVRPKNGFEALAAQAEISRNSL